MSETRELLVSEIFGPTIQGEGPSTGRLATFVRLGLCNLDCAWCDTPYTWDWTGKNGEPQDRTALFHRSVESIVKECKTRKAPLVVITGGEPMVQHRPLGVLVEELIDCGFDVEIETNGTIPGDYVLPNRWNVSIKLPGSGVDPRAAIKPHAIRWFVAHSTHVAFKFVIANAGDLGALDMLVDEYGIPARSMWLMPVGRTPHNILVNGKSLSGHAIERGWNLSTRLHVLLWGDERGR